MIFADAVTNVGQLFVNALAIAGAYLVGGQFSLWFSKFLTAVMLRRKPARQIQILARQVGGVGFALLVAFLVFGYGGWEFGGGGTEGEDSGTGKVVEKKSIASELPKVIDPKDEEPIEKKEVQPPPDQRERIIVLGGRDELDRYYRVEGTKLPIAFPQLTSHLRIRMQDTEKPLKGVSILVYQNSAARDHRLVKQLENWARTEKLSVDFPPVQNERIPD